MAKLTYCILLFILHQSVGDGSDCVINNNTPDYTWEHVLFKYLKDTLRASVLQNNCSVVEVPVHFILKYFSFDTEEELFSIQTWVFFVWNNPRLTWNPKDYGGLDHIRIPNFSIWAPYMKLLNGIENSFFLEISSLYCGEFDITYQGNLACIRRMHYAVKCKTNAQHWPYDTQKCTFNFGEWTFMKVYRTKVKFVSMSNGTGGINMVGAEYGAGWSIIGFEMREDLDNKTHLSLTFEVERQAKGLVAIIVIPAIIVSILTISCLILDIRNEKRIGMICFSLLIHFYLLSELRDIIPKHSEEAPLILQFVSGSLIITLINVALTFVLNYLRKRQLRPPLWIRAMNEYLFGSYVKYVIWPRWETTVDDIEISEDLNGKPALEEWTDFVNIVNSECLFIFIIVYAAMLPAFIPRALPALFKPSY